MKLAKNTIVSTTFDDYTLIEQVGTGGNGRVFSAKASDGEIVAIKFVEKTISSEKLKRFKNEINFCQRHHHKNIVPVLDHGRGVFDNKDFLFYVMPHYTETLREKIKKGIPHEKILGIFIGLLEGIKYAHEQKSIHRDLKPENIMFAEDSYEPIICDFGIAHFSEEDLLTVVETNATNRLANFQYAAPEQRKKGGHTYPQTDIYSLALILNEMFTNEIPQAAGYTRIKDINNEYAFLDDVFEQLFRQDPQERLFPENKILTEIKVREASQKSELEKTKLQSSIIEIKDVETFEANIVDVKCQDGKLIFYYDKYLPADWEHMIKYGSYSGSFMMNYDKHMLKTEGSNKLSMRLFGYENTDTIKRIVECVCSWTKTINYEYNNLLKENAEMKQREEEQKRLAEIKRIEKENEVNSVAKQALAELVF